MNNSNNKEEKVWDFDDFSIPTNEKSYDKVMNWDKVKKTIGDKNYNKLITSAVKDWLEYNNERNEALLEHEGLITTKRDKKLNELLDENN